MTSDRFIAAAADEAAVAICIFTMFGLDHQVNCSCTITF